MRKETLVAALLSLSPIEVLEVVGLSDDTAALVEVLEDHIGDNERSIDRELISLGLLDPEGEDYD